MKLSQAQRRALVKLSETQEGSGYGLRTGLVTLDCLVALGLAASRHDLGSIFSPHTAIKYRITDAGRSALASST